MKTQHDEEMAQRLTQDKLGVTLVPLTAAAGINLGDHQMMLSKQAVSRERIDWNAPLVCHRPEACVCGGVSPDCFYADRVAPTPAPAAAAAPPAAPPAAPHDDIKRPEHYARFAIEPITFIMMNDLPAWAANVVKYVCRAPHKHDREEQDIRKAIRYCEMRLELLKREREGTDGSFVNRPL